MESIRMCGSSWQYCDGNCDTCAICNFKYTTSTEVGKEVENDYN